MVEQSLDMERAGNKDCLVGSQRQKHIHQVVVVQSKCLLFQDMEEGVLVVVSTGTAQEHLHQVDT